MDTRIRVIKPLHAKWVVQFYDYVRGNRDVVMSGWRKSKIIDAVERQSVIQNDPFLQVCIIPYDYTERKIVYYVYYASFLRPFPLPSFDCARKLDVRVIAIFGDARKLNARKLNRREN